MAAKANSKWFHTGIACINQHLAPRSTQDGKCGVCKWLSWEKSRRAKGKKPFQPNETRWEAIIGGKRYFEGSPCPNGHNGTRWTHNGACIECTKLASDEYRRSDKGIEYSKKWKAVNKDKVQEYNRNAKAMRKGAEGIHTAQDVRTILTRQKYKCAECSQSVRKKSNRHVDHIMPIALGGTNWPSNLQVLCAPCNLSKNAKHPLDWARMKGRLL